MRVVPKTSVMLDLTSGVEFPKLDVAPKRENVPNASCRLAGRAFDVSDASPAANSLQFKTELPETGIATFWIKLAPRTLEWKPEQVKMFNEEVNAPEALQKEYDDMPEPKRWHGTSTKHPKTFCACRRRENRHVVERNRSACCSKSYRRKIQPRCTSATTFLFVC
jgi:hypothetical protein